jgi:2,3-dihydro-2,3-dihydroxybenzoate dehydrogenase
VSEVLQPPPFRPVALVTGAAGGIGASVAARLARAGAAVALVDRDRDRVSCAVQHLAAAGATVTAIAADVAEPGAMDDAVAAAEAQLGPLTMLACVAGVLEPSPLVALEDDQWQRHFDVNTTGVLRSLRAAARVMAPRGAGSIVVVTSNAARVPRQGLAAYAASKAATSMLVRVAGLELAADGIRCNTVEPGSTDTAMQRDLWPDAVEGARKALAGDPDSFRVGIPLGRIAHPDDVAAAVAFLLSDDARHITMQSLLVDGGATL